MLIKSVGYFRPNDSKTLFSYLLVYRFRYYFSIMKLTLLKYKLILIVLAALLAPSFAEIRTVLTKPFMILFDVNASNFLRLGIAYTYYLVTFLWLIIQSSSLKLPNYFFSFPINNKIIIKSNLCVIIVANNIILLPILLSSISHLKANAVLLLFVFLSQIIIQNSIFDRSYIKVIVALTANLVVFFIDLWQLELFFSVLFIFCLMTQGNDIFESSYYTRKSSANSLLLSYRKFLLWQLYLKYLFRNHWVKTLLRFSVILIIGVFFSWLMSTTQLAKQILSIQLAQFNISALMLSGITNSFISLRDDSKAYFSALPVLKVCFIRTEIALLFILIFTFDLAFFLLDKNFSFISIKLIIFQFILLLILYFFQLRWRKYGAVLGFSIAVIATIFAMLT